MIGVWVPDLRLSIMASHNLWPIVLSSLDPMLIYVNLFVTVAFWVWFHVTN